MQAGKRQAAEVAEMLSKEHKRRSDTEQVEMGRYIYCKDNEGRGNR